jgi:CRISPR-associated protein Cas6
MNTPAELATVVDVAFAVDGKHLEQDYRYDLMQAVTGCLPWLESEPGAGIHPIRSARDEAGKLLLSRRARLVLRLPESRIGDVVALTGCLIHVGGNPLRLGEASIRVLQPIATLYAHMVAARSGDEQTFIDDIAARLAELKIHCKIVCGKRQVLMAGPLQVTGFSLMLHDLEPEHSMMLQHLGLGAERRLGCGILVGHKSAAAVGA